MCGAVCLYRGDRNDSGIGQLNAIQLSKQVDREAAIRVAQTLLAMTYQHSSKELPAVIAAYLIDLPGGEIGLMAGELVKRLILLYEVVTIEELKNRVEYL